MKLQDREHFERSPIPEQRQHNVIYKIYNQRMRSRELIIEPGRAEKQYFLDLWRYRELFYFLAWRDILVRYKQTAIGIAWALLRPFLTMVVFTVVFGKLAKRKLI